MVLQSPVYRILTCKVAPTLRQPLQNPYSNYSSPQGNPESPVTPKAPFSSLQEQIRTHRLAPCLRGSWDEETRVL